MNSLSWTAVSASDFCQSPILRRTLATFTDGAYVRIDANGGNVALKSSGATSHFDISSKASAASRIDAAPGHIVSFELLNLSNGQLPPLGEDGQSGAWLAYICRFENGSEDHIFIRPRQSCETDSAVDILKAIWPVLREDCLKEAVSPEAKAAMNAMLWTVSKKTISAVFVLNAAGQVLHVNAAAREVLEQGKILRETPMGLACTTPQQTGIFRKAIRACMSDTNSKDTDFILFLDAGPDGVGKLPVSLSRYQVERDTMPLVVAIVPQQPDRERIEMLALKMGLTPSEARVAALMQMGLPNREAARIAGLKEQTFSTYSKRVLNKLNVGCRAEMAHMLTWQASVGRAS